MRLPPYKNPRGQAGSGDFFAVVGGLLHYELAAATDIQTGGQVAKL